MGCERSLLHVLLFKRLTGKMSSSHGVPIAVGHDGKIFTGPGSPVRTLHEITASQTTARPPVAKRALGLSLPEMSFLIPRLRLETPPQSSNPPLNPPHPRCLSSGP